MTELTAEVTQLRAALESSRVIGEALGLIMATHNVSHDDAWQALRRASQNRNRKLHDIAADLVTAHHTRLTRRPPASRSNLPAPHPATPRTFSRR